MAALVAEVFAHGAAGVWGDVLHGRRVRRRSRHHDAVLHGAEIFESFDHLRNSGAVLTNGDVDADHVAALLIDDRVERDSGLAALAFADDQLALAAYDPKPV